MDPKNPVMVKLSGDGARFSSTSSFTLLTLSFPEIATDVLSGAGMYSLHNLFPTTKTLIISILCEESGNDISIHRISALQETTPLQP